VRKGLYEARLLLDPGELFGPQDEPPKSGKKDDAYWSREIGSKFNLGLPELLDANQFFRPSQAGAIVALIGGKVFSYGRGQAGSWLVYIGSARNDADATRLGKRVKRALIGLRNLPASVKALHKRRFFVAYPGGYVEL
jgi:hypothetical protein